MVLSELAQVRGLAARENTAEHGRVEGFDTTVEDARVSCELLYRSNRDVERLYVGLSTACAIELYTESVQFVNNGGKTFFGKNRNQCGFDHPCVAQTHVWIFIGHKGTKIPCRR